MRAAQWLRQRVVRRPADERGAIIPMVATMLVVLIPSSAIAVDLGMQRVVRRDMQALADVVALDVVRLVDGRTAAQITSGYNGHPTLAAAIAKSVARNEDTLGDAPVVTVTLSFMDTATHRLETVVGAGGKLVTVEATGSQVPTAVEVKATGSVDFAFAPGDGGAVRTAVAVPSPSSCFRLGSFAAGVDTAQASLLDTLLPQLLNISSVSGTLVGYEGLASAQVSLLDLVAVPGLGVATPDELLDLEGVTVGQFYAAMATVLQNNGGPAAALSLLQFLSVHANLTSTIAVRELLGISTAGTAALGATFSILDLVTGAAYLANDENTLLVPGLSAQLPALDTGATISLKIGESPTLACGAVGKARARTGQVDLTITGTLADLPVTVPLMGGFTVQNAVTSRVFLAAAEGTLTRIVCGDATFDTNAEGIDVSVTSGLVSELAVTANLRVTATLTLAVGIVTVDLLVPTAASTTGGMSTGSVSFRHPPDSYGTGKRHGSSVIVPSLTTPSVPVGATAQLTPLLGPQVTVGTSTVPGLNAALTTVISQAVGNVNAGLVTQLNANVAPILARELGVTIGGADMFALPRPSCNDPALAG